MYVCIYKVKNYKVHFFSKVVFDTFKYFWNIYGSGILKIIELENVRFKAKLKFFRIYVYIR